MSAETQELKAILRSRLTGSQEDPSPKADIKPQLDLLSETMEAYEVGDYSKEEVAAIFDENPVPNFSILDWITQKDAEGVY